MVWQMGIVVKSDEESVEVFADNFEIEVFKADGLDRNLSLGIGSWLNWDTETGEMENRAPKFPAKVINGVLHVETLACCPISPLLEPENQQKWENIVWSPFVGKIHDVNDEFLVLVGNELYEVTVRFLGSNKKVLWEVVGCRTRLEDDKLQLLAAQAPWILEQIEIEIEATSKRDESDQPYTSTRANERFRFCGVVIKRDDEGFSIWGHSVGLYRVRSEENVAELGCWYAYCLRGIKSLDFRRYGRRKDVFENTACNLQITEPRLETVRIDENEYGVVTQLKLSQKIQKDKFYFDYELGKVELPQSMILGILEKTKKNNCALKNLRIIGIAKYLQPRMHQFIEAAEWTLTKIDEIYTAEGIKVFPQEC